MDGYGAQDSCCGAALSKQCTPPRAGVERASAESCSYSSTGFIKNCYDLFVVYLTTLSVARGTMVDGYQIGKDVDGSGRGLTRDRPPVLAFAWRDKAPRIFGLRAEVRI
jgi:hypothetical protein